jgi:hypothetical protein
MRIGNLLSTLGLCGVLLLCSCASVGKKFRSVDPAFLKLRETTEAQCIQQFGRPQAERSVKNSDGDFRSLRYLYVARQASGSIHGRFISFHGRILLLEFNHGLLNAYGWISTFPEDYTWADREKLDLVQKGISDKAAVIQAMGEPAGKGLCPSIGWGELCQKGKEVWSWTQVIERRGTRIIVIVFDDMGIVSEVQVSENRQDPIRVNPW